MVRRVAAVHLQPEFPLLEGAKAAPRTDVEPLVRGGRYCEVMVVRKNGRKFEAEVWSTQGLSTCPEDCAAAINADDIKSQTGAQRVVVNGPKIWLPNSPAPTPPNDARKRFGGIEMGLVATTEVNRGDSQPLKERVVPRETSNTFNRGEEIYELVSPDNVVYVMHSMSLSESPNLTMDQLPTLERLLELPKGWSYRAQILEQDLVLGPRDGKVVVLQDRLKNTYQKLTLPP
jgi:hypothetical protein